MRTTTASVRRKLTDGASPRTTTVPKGHVADERYRPAEVSVELGTLGSRTDELEKQLRDKVRSKMDEAKLLGGVVAVVLAVFLDTDAITSLGNPLEVRLAAVSFVVDLVLVLGTVDVTTACFKRWKHNRRSREEPRTLKDAMIHTWKWFFGPASTALVLGVALLADAAVDPPWWWRIGAIAALLAALAYVYLARPISLKSAKDS